MAQPMERLIPRAHPMELPMGRSTTMFEPQATFRGNDGTLGQPWHSPCDVLRDIPSDNVLEVQWVIPYRNC